MHSSTMPGSLGLVESTLLRGRDNAVPLQFAVVRKADIDRAVTEGNNLGE